MSKANERAAKRRKKYTHTNKQGFYIEASRVLKYHDSRVINIGTEVNTPFGIVNASGKPGPGDTKQIMIKSNRDKYYPKSSKSSKKNDWLSYRTWASALDTYRDRAALIQDLRRAIEGNHPPTGQYDDNQRRAAASLLATGMIAEEYRHDNAQKHLRDTLQAMQEMDLSFTQAFGGDDPVFAMAATEAGENMRAIIYAEMPLSVGQHKLAEALTDTSDEEDPAAEKDPSYEYLTANNLERVHIPPDGDCFYNAVRDQMRLAGMTVPKVAELRKRAARYIRDNAASLARFFSEDATAEQVARSIEQPRAWNHQGGDIVTQLMPSVIGRPITIVQANVPRTMPMLQHAQQNDRPPLVILYNGQDHYASTRPTGGER